MFNINTTLRIVTLILSIMTVVISSYVIYDLKFDSAGEKDKYQEVLGQNYFMSKELNINESLINRLNVLDYKSTVTSKEIVSDLQSSTTASYYMYPGYSVSPTGDEVGLKIVDASIAAQKNEVSIWLSEDKKQWVLAGNSGQACFWAGHFKITGSFYSYDITDPKVQPCQADLPSQMEMPKDKFLTKAKNTGKLSKTATRRSDNSLHTKVSNSASFTRHFNLKHFTMSSCVDGAIVNTGDTVLKNIKVTYDDSLVGKDTPSKPTFERFDGSQKVIGNLDNTNTIINLAPGEIEYYEVCVSPNFEPRGGVTGNITITVE